MPFNRKPRSSRCGPWFVVWANRSEAIPRFEDRQQVFGDGGLIGQPRSSLFDGERNWYALAALRSSAAMKAARLAMTASPAAASCSVRMSSRSRSTSLPGLRLLQQFVALLERVLVRRQVVEIALVDLPEDDVEEVAAVDQRAFDGVHVLGGEQDHVQDPDVIRQAFDLLSVREGLLAVLGEDQLQVGPTCRD
ncbi:MAG: hypothetical protein MZU97_10175 [Bacillus subtilis]|nr:hypothetical protein [Bacillus subtilis]